MRKPRKVTKPKERRHLALVTNLPTCEDHSCKRSSSVFHRWKWWCAKHDPGDQLAANCAHRDPSHIEGQLMCAWCCGTVAYDWPRAA